MFLPQKLADGAGCGEKAQIRPLYLQVVDPQVLGGEGPQKLAAVFTAVDGYGIQAPDFHLHYVASKLLHVSHGWRQPRLPTNGPSYLCALMPDLPPKGHYRIISLRYCRSISTPKSMLGTEQTLTDWRLTGTGGRLGSLVCAQCAGGAA